MLHPHNLVPKAYKTVGSAGQKLVAAAKLPQSYMLDEGHTKTHGHKGDYLVGDATKHVIMTATSVALLLVASPADDVTVAAYLDNARIE